MTYSVLKVPLNPNQPTPIGAVCICVWTNKPACFLLVTVEVTVWHEGRLLALSQLWLLFMADSVQKLLQLHQRLTWRSNYTNSNCCRWPWLIIVWWGQVERTIAFDGINCCGHDHQSRLSSPQQLGPAYHSTETVMPHRCVRVCIITWTSMLRSH